jgi:hypothetical protein
MKIFMTLILLIGILSIAMSLFACQSQTHDLTTPTAIKTTTSLIQSPSPALEATAQAQLTQEEKMKMWEEKGIYNADTLEEASRIVGYQVAVPSYIPEGFGRYHNIIISKLGGGSGFSEEMKPKFTAINIVQMWRWDSDRSITFMLTQSQHKFGIGGDQEQVEIGGLKVIRSVTQMEPPRPNVEYAWEKDGVSYALSGYLQGALDEAAMEKILGSISSSSE